jgi:peptidoglycan/xylan/chitin deacetylase (PgdA/CDA1 family)
MQNIKIPILMYHSIESMPKTTVMRSLHVPPRRFDFQMKMLKLLGYQALSLKKLKPYLDGKKQGKVVGITFDDGYQNNLINAVPILLKYNFSATCYIVSENLGLSNTWDLDKGITQRPLMTIDEIKSWLSFGMDIGGHTQTHADLTKISIKAAKREINTSKGDLENTFNTQVTDFCYPFGRFDDLISDLVKESGYLSATTMERGIVKSMTNRFMLPRMPINHRTLPHLFLAKILTNYEDRR